MTDIAAANILERLKARIQELSKDQRFRDDPTLRLTGDDFEEAKEEAKKALCEPWVPSGVVAEDGAICFLGAWIIRATSGSAMPEQFPLVSHSHEEPEPHYRWDNGQWQQRWKVVTWSNAKGSPSSCDHEWRNCVLEEVKDA